MSNTRTEVARQLLTDLEKLTDLDFAQLVRNAEVPLPRKEVMFVSEHLRGILSGTINVGSTRLFDALYSIENAVFNPPQVSDSVAQSRSVSAAREELENRLAEMDLPRRALAVGLCADGQNLYAPIIEQEQTQGAHTTAEAARRTSGATER